MVHTHKTPKPNNSPSKGANPPVTPRQVALGELLRMNSDRFTAFTPNSGVRFVDPAVSYCFRVPRSRFMRGKGAFSVFIVLDDIEARAEYEYRLDNAIDFGIELPRWLEEITCDRTFYEAAAESGLPRWKVLGAKDDTEHEVTFAGQHYYVYKVR